MEDLFDITLEEIFNSKTKKLSRESSSLKCNTNSLSVVSSSKSNNKFKDIHATSLCKRKCSNSINTKERYTIEDHFKCKKRRFRNTSNSQVIQSSFKDSIDCTYTNKVCASGSELKTVFSKYGVNYSDKSISDEFDRSENSTQCKDVLSKRIDEDTLISLKEIEIQNDLLNGVNMKAKQDREIADNKDIVHNMNEYNKLLEEDYLKLPYIQEAERPNSSSGWQKNGTKDSTSKQKEHNCLNNCKTSLCFFTNRTNEGTINTEDFVSLGSQNPSQRYSDFEITPDFASEVRQSQILIFPNHGNSSTSEERIISSTNINSSTSLKEKRGKTSDCLNNNNLIQKFEGQTQFNQKQSEILMNPITFRNTPLEHDHNEDKQLDNTENLNNKTDTIVLMNRAFLKGMDSNHANNDLSNALKQNNFNFNVCSTSTFNDKIDIQKSVSKGSNFNSSQKNKSEFERNILSQNNASKDHILKKKFAQTLSIIEKENYPMTENSNYKTDVKYLKKFIEEKLHDIQQYFYRNQLNKDKNINIISQVLLDDLNHRTDDDVLLEHLESQDIFSQPISCTPIIKNHASMKFSSPSEKHLNKDIKQLGDIIDAFVKDKTLICQEEYEVQIPDEVKQRFIIGKIKNVFTKLMYDIENGIIPTLQIRNQHDWSNCTFDENKMILKPPDNAKTMKICLDRKRSRATFNTIVFIMGKILDLLIKNNYFTKRELYYQIKNFVKNQAQINSAVDMISFLLDEPPWDFGILAMSKGLVYGDLVVTLEGDEVINYNVPGGSLVPQNQDKIKKFESNSSFILIVEKDSIFQKLLDEDILNQLPRTFIMITGKGFPDVSTRLFVKKLWQVLRVPVFILVDADPYGIEIMLTYKFGSLSLLHLSEYLALPNLKWIGVHPSEIISLNITRQILTEKDKGKIKSLLERPYINYVPKIKDQIEIMLERNFKAEIEGLIKSSRYLGNFYLPSKLVSLQEFL